MARASKRARLPLPFAPAIGGVWLAAPSERSELCLSAFLTLIPPSPLRIRVLEKQPRALQLIISPNLHLLQAVIGIAFTEPQRPTADITQSSLAPSYFSPPLPHPPWGAPFLSHLPGSPYARASGSWAVLLASGAP